MSDLVHPAMKPEMVDLILRNIADGVFTVDRQFRITYFNKAAEQITGFRSDEALGKGCAEIFRTPLCGRNCPLRRTIDSNLTVQNFEIDILTRDHGRQTVSVSTAPLVDRNGQFLGGVETFRNVSQSGDLNLEVTTKHSFHGIVCQNERMRQITDTLPNIGQSDAPVLLVGSEGTGKDMIARAIHAISPRSEAAFVKVDCTRLGGALVESELTGFFAAARRGTVFLDGVASMALSVQSRLLGLLEDLSTVSERRAKGAPDMRVLSAAKRDVGALVAEGGFRRELFRRLAEIVVPVPDLNERRDDIPLLVEYFVERCNRRMGRALTGMSEDAIELLTRFGFPGNVRELERVVEYGCIVASGAHIEIDDLPPHVADARWSRNGPESSEIRRHGLRWPPDRDVEERQRLAECLQRNLWNIQRAAQELDMHRTTLWRKIKRFNINRPGGE